MSRPRDDPRIVRGMTTQLERRRERLDAGEQPLGWKVGFGSPGAMNRLGIYAPLVGFLTDRAVVPSGGTVSLDGWTNAVAEPEVAVYLGQDLGGEPDCETATRAIAGLAAAIELADVDPPPDDVEEILAGNVFQRACVLGRMDASRRGGSFDGLVGRVAVDGEQVGMTDDPRLAIGDPIDVVRHVADVLADFGEELRAGEVIITGSVVAPLAARPGQHVVFELDPVGSVEVRFADERSPTVSATR